MGTLNRTQLWATYGQPTRADTAVALRTIGKGQEVHPKDAVAYLYRDQEAADAFAASNLETYGLSTLGSYATHLGVIAVLDLRPSMRAHGSALTDPAEAD